MEIMVKSSFLDACRRRKVDRTPVWFMRQAGRSLPEYRAVRGEGSILDAIKQPELAAEIEVWLQAMEIGSYGPRDGAL